MSGTRSTSRTGRTSGTGAVRGRHRVPTALVAGVGLVLAFTVAQLTQVRALGGVVLVATAAWCVLREVRRTGWW